MHDAAPLVARERCVVDRRCRKSS